METLQEINGASPRWKTFEPPFISVIMPVFNEEKFIARSLAGILEQDYPPDKMEIVIADGMSTDRTREIIRSIQREHPIIRLIDNPKRIVPTGLNLAIASARGEIIVRLDGHCEYPKNYVRRVVELRRELQADNVGGVLWPLGGTYVGKAVAAAYCSPVGLGGAALKGEYGRETIREVDAVHGGCWERRRLLEAGGFDETMVRNQDDELSFRLRKKGGRIFQSLGVRVKYHVRGSFKKLFFQFAQYGFWKVAVVRKHPKQCSLRHFAPSMLVLALIATGVFTFYPSTPRGEFLALIGGYLAILSAASIRQTWASEKQLWPGLVLALAMMHFGYGLGFLAGGLNALGLLPRHFFERSTR